MPGGALSELQLPGERVMMVTARRRPGVTEYVTATEENTVEGRRTCQYYKSRQGTRAIDTSR